jgi:hypothetical protein
MQFNALQLYLNGLMIFSHFLNYQHVSMSWIIHFELIETIIQMLHIAFIIIWDTQNNLMSRIYTWIGWWKFSHLLNYQHLHMSWIIHFECVKSIIHELHFELTTIFWNGCIKTKHVSHLYLNVFMFRSNVHAH